MKSLELERTFLAKHLPADLKKHLSKEIIDIYIPKSVPHPVLRIRKSGDMMEITKKFPVGGDASEQHEHTITLSREEFDALSKIEGKKTRKIRYYYPCMGRKAEIDIFLGELQGLVLVDFEFSSKEDKSSFNMPDFCLADVTQETFLAGGMLCSRSFAELEQNLKKFGYSKLSLD